MVLTSLVPLNVTSIKVGIKSENESIGSSDVSGFVVHLYCREGGIHTFLCVYINASHSY